ncbi:hypothetical protein JXA12_00420 [Candidatus Woesearchaeota archaeon]|nr:hypothetical protein [Candidatus Woesearchaeota archaeon]
MRIGLDFDGVIADSDMMKRRVAKERYGVDIPRSRLDKEGAVKSGLLTEESYSDVQERVYASKKYGRQTPPVKHMRQAITDLQGRGHALVIVTSRNKRKSAIAKDWLAAHGLEIPLRSVGRRKKKTSSCADLDAFVDDDLHHLLPLIGEVKRLYLFDQYGKNQAVPAGITTVAGWEQLLAAIKRSR